MNKLWLSVMAPLLLAACSKDEGTEKVPVDIEAGKVIAEARCAGCHGLDGRGVASDIPNLAAQPQDYLVDALLAYREGRRRHAALQNMATDMSTADIHNIAGYYSSQSPLEPLPAADGSLSSQASYREGAEMAAVCVECHGENGFSEEPGIPSLAGQQPAYLIVSMQEYARGLRGHQEKEAMLREMEQVDIEKMALYFASQIPPVRQPPEFGDPARGEPLSASCGECHGERGVSHDPLVPSLAGQQPDYLVKAIKAYRDGQREHEEMVADKSDPEIDDIAAFYAVQKLEAADDRELAVQELAAKCDRCHNPAGRPSSLTVPSLAGQNREYLVRVMKAYRDNDRSNSMMHKMSAGYSDEMIEELADHYSSQ